MKRYLHVLIMTVIAFACLTVPLSLACFWFGWWAVFLLGLPFLPIIYLFFLDVPEATR